MEEICSEALVEAGRHPGHPGSRCKARGRHVRGSGGTPRSGACAPTRGWRRGAWQGTREAAPATMFQALPDE